MKTGKTFSTYAITKRILESGLNGTFLQHHMEKVHVTESVELLSALLLKLVYRSHLMNRS